MSEEAKSIAELTRLPLSRWKLYQCIILDWHDVPLEGFCELESPAINFYFKVFASNELSINNSFIYKAYITSDRKFLADFRKEIGKSFDEKYPFWNPLLDSDLPGTSLVNLEISKLISIYQLKQQFLIRSENMKKFLEIWRILP